MYAFNKLHFLLIFKNYNYLNETRSDAGDDKWLYRFNFQYKYDHVTISWFSAHSVVTIHHGILTSVPPPHKITRGKP